MSQTGGFAGDTLEQIVDEAVHDAHGLAGDTSVGVHLLHDFVDIDAVALSSFSAFLLVPRTRGFRFGDGLLGAFGAYFRRHFRSWSLKNVMSKGWFFFYIARMQIRGSNNFRAVKGLGSGDRE